MAGPLVLRAYNQLPSGQVHWRCAGAQRIDVGLTTDGELPPPRIRESQSDADRGRPLICLHMMPKSSRSFQVLMPELAGRRLVLAPDLPGHGASDPLEPPPSVPDYGRWLWEWLDTLGLAGPVDLLGYHTGAMIAVAATAQDASRVGRLVAISAPAFTADEITAFQRYFTPVPLDEEGTRFLHMWPRVRKHAGPGMTLEMAAASFSDNLLAGEGYEDGHQAAFAYAPRFLRDLQGLAHSVLVMNIADELFEATTRIDAWLGNGERRDYPHWGNGFLELQAPAVAAEILAFLDGGA